MIRSRGRLEKSVEVQAAPAPTGSGSVYSSVDGYCSGTLLSNRWVLTARHCFCQASVNSPGTVKVSVYGSLADAANQQLGQLYSTTAAQIIRHPTYDVALIKLNQTLPFYEPPFIYRGTGTDLVGKTASAWGFGNDQLSGGHAIGLGEALNWTVLNVTKTGTTSTGIGTGCTPAETDLPASGPWAQTAAGNGARLQDGDSGGPLFVEPTSTIPDLSQHVLAGVYRGVTLGSDGKWIQQYTGLWLIRDWIRTTAPDLAPRSACPAYLPNSAGATAPAVAEGPDSAIHVVAVQSNGVLGHWRFIDGRCRRSATSLVL